MTNQPCRISNCYFANVIPPITAVSRYVPVLRRRLFKPLQFITKFKGSDLSLYKIALSKNGYKEAPLFLFANH